MFIQCSLQLQMEKFGVQRKNFYAWATFIICLLGFKMKSVFISSKISNFVKQVFK